MYNVDHKRAVYVYNFSGAAVEMFAEIPGASLVVFVQVSFV